MDNIGETSSISQNSFVKHVFNFDSDTKNELLNLTQYLLLAIIPISFYNHFLESVIPELDEKKSNFEVLTEIIIQLSLTFVGLFFVHRLITFIPPYSGRSMLDMNLFNVVLVFFVVSFNTKSKLGDKTRLLINRSIELWEGKKETSEKKPNQVQVTQPISNMQQSIPTHQASRADYVQNHNLMTAPQAPSIPNVNQGNSGASNDMYNNNNFGGLVNAQSPMLQEPMAANSMGGFSSW